MKTQKLYEVLYVAFHNLRFVRLIDERNTSNFKNAYNTLFAISA